MAVFPATITWRTPDQRPKPYSSIGVAVAVPYSDGKKHTHVYFCIYRSRGDEEWFEDGTDGGEYISVWDDVLLWFYDDEMTASINELLNKMEIE